MCPNITFCDLLYSTVTFFDLMLPTVAYCAFCLTCFDQILHSKMLELTSVTYCALMWPTMGFPDLHWPAIAYCELIWLFDPLWPAVINASCSDLLWRGWPAVNWYGLGIFFLQSIIYWYRLWTAPTMTRGNFVYSICLVNGCCSSHANPCIPVNVNSLYSTLVENQNHIQVIFHHSFPFVNSLTGWPLQRSNHQLPPS